MKKLALILFLFLAHTAAWAQCAMCRTTIENNVSNGDTTFAAGLNLGILYLFAAPYVMVLVIGFLWYRKSRMNGRDFKTGSHKGT